MNGRVRSGDRVVFGISGSGQTVGTALYTLDDLPDRLREKASGGVDAIARPASSRTMSGRIRRPGVRIESLGIAPRTLPRSVDTLGLVQAAAADCFCRSKYGRADVDLLMFAGVYRSQFLSEPAVAALAAGELGINGDVATPDGPRTFAFDVINGGVGLPERLPHRRRVDQARQAPRGDGRPRRKSRTTGRTARGDRPGVLETGSAAILDASPEAGQGFVAFLFKSYPEHARRLSAYTGMVDGRARPARRARRPARWRSTATASATPCTSCSTPKACRSTTIQVILPPQVAPGSLPPGAGLGVDPDGASTSPSRGTTTSALQLVHAMQHALERGMATSGDLGLVIAVGSGIQVGCALYRF